MQNARTLKSAIQFIFQFIFNSYSLRKGCKNMIVDAVVQQSTLSDIFYQFFGFPHFRIHQHKRASQPAMKFHFIGFKKDIPEGWSQASRSGPNNILETPQILYILSNFSGFPHYRVCPHECASQPAINCHFYKFSKRYTQWLVSCLMFPAPPRTEK